MDSSFLLNLEVKKYDNPWSYYVIDNFLPSESFKKLQQQLCAVDAGFEKQDDDIFQINFMFLPDLTLAKFFIGEAFQEFLQRVTQKSLEISDTGLVQLRRMTPNSPAMPPHIDAADERSLVCIYYLSPNWHPQCGGELLLHPDNLRISRQEAVAIEPLANRMVLFFTDNTNWHSVVKVNNWNRYSVLSEWIVQEG
ncbi:2OG-Fe(II) oxygenase [Bdellovibrio reynosensis]|uniref:2OG-Fe(II) oxygenase n=1 Tax=Bdellovibrio reynosensis TaxID=2835041 RepID=A0ABY4C8W7_9BACT|nr:2OG-Fe(II) oxygenase [Bdellovibrio reynosensis]UOF01380.1 2OG-Fe(II) oxygenase [Bdellovibrio reynosensis]